MDAPPEGLTPVRTTVSPWGCIQTSDCVRRWMARENIWLRSCTELRVRCVAQEVPACWIPPVSPSVDLAAPVAGMPPEVAALPRLPG
eukprot:2938593-Pyramimonas_sp.AAC.1